MEWGGGGEGGNDKAVVIGYQGESRKKTAMT